MAMRLSSSVQSAAAMRTGSTSTPSKWYTGKVAPKKYGDKLDLNVTGTVTVAIEEGRQRVARMHAGHQAADELCILS